MTQQAAHGGEGPSVGTEAEGRSEPKQSPISGEGAWGHAYRRIKFEDGLEIPDAPWTLTREDGCFLLLLKGDPEHWEVQPLYAAPPVPSVSGGEDQGSNRKGDLPTEQAEPPVVGNYALHPFDDLLVQIEKIEDGRASYRTLSPSGFGSCPVSGLRPFPRQKPADGSSSNEGVKK